MTTQVRVLGRWLGARWVSTVARLVVGGVYLGSSLTKIGDIDGTIRTVRAYRLLPEAIAPTFGSALPIVELCLAGLLVAGLLTRIAAGLTIVMSAMFFFGVASAWARGLEIQCGCFGNNGAATHPVPGYVRELVLNAVLIAICVWLVRRPASGVSLDSALGLQLDDDGDDDNGDPGNAGPAPSENPAGATRNSGKVTSRKSGGRGAAVNAGEKQ